MAKKALSDLSSDELYELARKREEQEAAAAQAAAREQIDALRQQRREIVARLGHADRGYRCRATPHAAVDGEVLRSS